MHRLAPALILLAAAPVAAQNTGNTATQTLRVAAEAAPACVIDAATASRGAVNAAFTPDGNGGGTIAIAELVDPQTAEPRASSIDLALPVRCNAAHRLVVFSTRGGLLRAGGQQTNRLTRNGFADLLPYRIDVDWAGNSGSASSDAGPALAGTQSASNGELRVRVAIDAGGGALVAGRYSDAITIRFEPAS
jgi:hypothetical protein